MKASGTRRERGAYFTPAWLAVELANWAIRSAHDTVIDPAAGDGALVVAAADRLRALGKPVVGSIQGIELHKRTAERLTRRLNGSMGAIEIRTEDFFAALSNVRCSQVVIANPPFVRHHEIPARLLPKMRAALNGKADLVGGRASAWAYFLLASTELLRPGGRLAMILPTDVLNADYARPILRHLKTKFGSVTLAMIELATYSGLTTRAVACLADEFGSKGPERDVVLARLSEAGLERLQRQPTSIAPDEFGSLSTLRQLTMPESVRAELAELRTDSGLCRLDEQARITIGYVSSASEYFQLTETERLEREINLLDVRQALTSTRSVNGVIFREEDWRRALKTGKPCWLFTPRKLKTVAVERYLAHGRYLRIHQTYKSQRRSPWWSVPLPQRPADAFLTSLGSRQMIVENRAGVLASNTLIELTATSELRSGYLALASLTSVFQLTAAVNSRMLSGGLWKLEPGSARSILLPNVTAIAIASTLAAVDRLIRAGERKAAESLADEVLLRRGLGWSRRRVARLAMTCARARQEFTWTPESRSLSTLRKRSANQD